MLMVATKQHAGIFYKGIAAEIAAVTPPANAQLTIRLRATANHPMPFFKRVVGDGPSMFMRIHLAQISV